MNRGEMLLVAGAGVAVTVTGWWALTTTQAIEATLSWHGIIALALGVGVSLLLGIGLMNLAYRSSRSGHDEAAHEVEKEIRPPKA